MSAERPRDALGRPLPADSRSGHVAEPVVDVTGLSDAQVWSAAQAYLDRDLPFHAHEVFEQRWRTCEPGDRSTWRALAQWGAALTHAARGNETGSRRLAERTLSTLDAAEHIPPCIDVDAVHRSCRSLVSG